MRESLSTPPEAPQPSEPYTYRCNRCHRPMRALTVAEAGCVAGACECGGLIEATPLMRSAEPVADEAPAGWSVAEGEPQGAAPASKRWTVESGRFLSFDGKRRFRLDIDNLTAGEPRYCAPWEGDNMAHVLCMLLNRSLTTFPVPEEWAQEARLDGGCAMSEPTMRAATSAIHAEPGTYRLRYEVQNPSPDRRCNPNRISSWHKWPTWPAGMLFIVDEYRALSSTPPSIRIYACGGFAMDGLHSFDHGAFDLLLPALVQVEETPRDYLLRRCGSSAGSVALDILNQGRLTVGEVTTLLDLLEERDGAR